MHASPAQRMMARETRVAHGPVPHALDGQEPDPDTSILRGDEFLLRAGQDHWFHYRRGAGITVERGANADPEGETLWLNGSLYSAVAAINGLMPMHASAVCHDGRVYAFTGPSGAGKSTLVTALSARGLPMFCDDTLVLDLSGDDAIVCLPGHKRLKLTAEALGLTGAVAQERVGRDIAKNYARPPHRHEGGPLPLERLFFIEESGQVTLEPLRGAERIMRLQDDHYTSNFYAAARDFDGAGLFAHLASLARRIDMMRFARPFSLACFDEGVDRVERYIRAGSDSSAMEHLS